MRKGETMPEWLRDKVSKSRTGKALGNKNGFKKGQTSYWKGKSPSKATREKMRLAKLGKPSPKKGKPISDEQKVKISKKLTGQTHSIERLIANREAQIRRHKKNNPNYELATRNKRIASNGGFHSNGEWENVKAQYNWTCPGCKKKEPEIKLTKDHIIPLSKGGSDNIENIQPLCQPCNSRKNTQIVRY